MQAPLSTIAVADLPGGTQPPLGPATESAPSPDARGRRRGQVTRGNGSTSVVARYVTIGVAAAMTGYTTKAIRRKIESGIWAEGREFRRAPDGHVLISVKGYEQWVERGRG